MASVKKAASAIKEGAELAAAVALSQPRITGTGSSQKFDNPWPEWQVFCRSKQRLQAFCKQESGTDLAAIAGTGFVRRLEVGMGPAWQP